VIIGDLDGSERAGRLADRAQSPARAGHASGYTPNFRKVTVGAPPVRR